MWRAEPRLAVVGGGSRWASLPGVQASPEPAAEQSVSRGGTDIGAIAVKSRDESRGFHRTAETGECWPWDHRSTFGGRHEARPDEVGVRRRPPRRDDGAQRAVDIAANAVGRSKAPARGESAEPSGDEREMVAGPVRALSHPALMLDSVLAVVGARLHHGWRWVHRPSRMGAPQPQPFEVAARCPAKEPTPVVEVLESAVPAGLKAP